MRMIKLIGLAALISLQVAANAQAPRPDQLVVTRTPSAYHLAVPVSRMVMTIADLKLVQEPNPANGPRYFFFNDDIRGLVISGWFEPAQLFKGVQTFWTEEVATWRKQGLPEPLNVEMTRVGKWDAIFYETQLPKVSNGHLRAHWVQAGTWIDLHISLTSKSPAATSREALQNVLNGIAVTERQ